MVISSLIEHQQPANSGGTPEFLFRELTSMTRIDLACRCPNPELGMVNVGERPFQNPFSEFGSSSMTANLTMAVR
jgi:hypothetical protein